MSGWFSIKRGITSHPIFAGQPERIAIWVWLLDHACWQDTKHDVNGSIVIVPRGSVSASERRIAKEVGVGYQVVRTFLARLKAEHMINAEVTQGRNLITLCNWDKYQTPKEGHNAAPNAAVTHDQRTKEQGNKYSVSKDTGAAAPNDPEKVMFEVGKRVLCDAGKTAAAAGKLLGKWRRDHGTEAVIVAIGRAQREGAIDPVSFIEGCLRFKAKRDDVPEIGTRINMPDGRVKVWAGAVDGWMEERS